MRDFIPAGIACVRRESVIERLTVNIQGMSGKTSPHREWQVGVGSVWHGCSGAENEVRLSTTIQRNADRCVDFSQRLVFDGICVDYRRSALIT